MTRFPAGGTIGAMTISTPDFARVIVRMEDLIFYGKQVMETLCECGGGGIPRQEHFQHIPQTAIWKPQLRSEESFL